MLFLAGLGMASYFLALCYCLASAVTCTKFHRVSYSTRGGWSTIQLFVLSTALACIFRTMSFSTLCFLDFQKAELPSSDTSHHKFSMLRQKDDLFFYNKVVAILFSIPDYLFVSSYLLLILVWAESFQSSRRHWFSAENFRRRWMIFYLIFNAGLYSTQVVLYVILIFFDNQDIYATGTSGHQLNTVPGLIFYCLAAADLLIPLVIFISWIYMNISLSGFPYKSPEARRTLQRVGKVAMAWSVGRILYSVMICLTFTRGWFNVNEHNVSTQSMVLVAVFLASELAPIYIALDSELLLSTSSSGVIKSSADTAPLLLH